MGKSLRQLHYARRILHRDASAARTGISPMTTVRFILQAHYRGTVDFSNEALKASEKSAPDACSKAIADFQELTPSEESTIDVSNIRRKCYGAMDDDMNTPIVIAKPSSMRSALSILVRVKGRSCKATQADIDELKAMFRHLPCRHSRRAHGNGRKR